MKKHLLKITALILFIGLIAACEEDKIIYKGEGSQVLAAFKTTAGTLPVLEGTVSSATIGIDVSSATTADRSIVLSVDPSSSAIVSQYQINAATLIIPAGSYNGSITITGNFSALNLGETVILVLNLDSVGDATLDTNKKKFELSIFKSCISELAGTYASVTTNMGEPGGGRVAGPQAGTVTFTKISAGLYSISDAAFGGTTGLYGPGNSATGVTLQDICNQISYTGVDQYGEIFTFSNLTVNASKLSFHWENDYGEFGDTTLTRTDGTSWPSLFL